jgi:single stranded DNA-binding protein
MNHNHQIRITGKILQVAERGKGRYEVALGGARPGTGQMVPWYLRLSFFPKKGEGLPWKEEDQVFFLARLSSFTRREGGRGLGLTAIYGYALDVPLPTGANDLPVGASPEIWGLGNLTAVPDLRYTPTGRAVMSGVIAINTTTSRINNTATREAKQTHFLPFTLWGESAERLADYLQRGQLVAFQGYLYGESWTTKSGEKRYALKAELTSLLPMRRRDRDVAEGTFPALSPASFEDLPPEEDLPF